jgi:hypothetical protein
MLTEILAPEAAIFLIEQDLNVSYNAAKTHWKNSKAYGQDQYSLGI